MSVYENVDEVVNVTINGTSVDDKFIRYRRDQNICTGIATLEVALTDDGTDYQPWDVIRIYEHDSIRGVFYTSVCRRDANQGTYTLQAQDASKKLTDYFISDSYTIEEYSETMDWIPVFLNEAGVSYSIGAIDSVPLSTNSQLGLMSAYDQIVQLLQYSGAYMYFDYDGTCIIGSMAGRGRGTLSLDDGEITSIKKVLHDGMLRNRAVVWGNSDPDTGEWVFADLTTHTPYNYDSRDQRAVVLSNHNIATVSDAQMMARRLLSEFARINNEHEVVAAGLFDAHVGRWLRARSAFGSVDGLITTSSHEVSAKGMVTSLTVNERCPRMWAFWSSLPGEYVYVGTAGEGVWRKPLDGSSWEDFSTILSGSYITDLYINNENFVSVVSGESDGGAYYRTLSAGWTKLVPSGVTNVLSSGVSLTENDLVAQACVINHTSNELSVAYNNVAQYSGGWVVTFSGTQQNNVYQAYVISGALVSGYVPTEEDRDYAVTILDIDSADTYNMLTIGVPASGIMVSGMGLQRYWTWEVDPEAHVTFPKPDLPANPVEFNWGDYYWNGSTEILMIGGYLDMRTNVTTQWPSNDRVYAYFGLQRTYGGDTEYRLYRCHYVPGPIDEDYWEDQYIAFTSSIPPAGIEQSIIYKETDEDDVVYLVTLSPGPKMYDPTGGYGGAEVTKFDFNGEGSYEQVVYYPFPTNNLGQTVNGSKIFVWHYVRILDLDEDGNGTCTDVYYVDVIDIITGATTTQGAGSWTFTIRTNALPRYTPGQSAPVALRQGGAIPIPNEHVALAACYWMTYWDAGILYGSDTADIVVVSVEETPFMDDHYLKLNVEQDPVDGNVVGLGNGHTDVGKFLGHQGGFTYVGAKFGWHAWNSDMTKEKLGTLIYCLKYDSSGSPTIAYSNRYHTGEFPTGHAETLAAWTSEPMYSIGWPLSSRYRDLGLFMDAEHFYIDGIIDIWDVYSMTKTAEIQHALTPSYEFTHILDQRLDDIDNLLYISDSDALRGYDPETGDLKCVMYDDPIRSYDPLYVFEANNLLVRINEAYSIYSNIAIDVILAQGLDYWWTLPTASGDISYVVKQTGELFETLMVASGQYVLDISNDTPTEIFTRTAEGIDEGNTIYQSFTNLSGEYSEITPTYPVFDLRTTRFVQISGTVASGTMDSPDGQYALIGSQDAIKGFPTSLSGSSITYATFSGAVVQIETTRIMQDPYIFAAISGAGASGVSGWAFHQRNPGGGNVFTQYAAPAAVTVIRMDDQF